MASGLVRCARGAACKHAEFVDGELFDDAPEPDEVQGADDPRVTLVCLDCLLDDHPELARGLDIAREYGVADLDENDESGRGRPQPT